VSVSNLEHYVYTQDVWISDQFVEPIWHSMATQVLNCSGCEVWFVVHINLSKVGMQNNSSKTKFCLIWRGCLVSEGLNFSIDCSTLLGNALEFKPWRVQLIVTHMNVSMISCELIILFITIHSCNLWTCLCFLGMHQPLSCTLTMDVCSFKSTLINCKLHVVICIWINSYVKHIHGCLHLNLTMYLPSMLFTCSCLAHPNYQLYKIDVVHVIPKKAKHGKEHQVDKIDGCHLKLHYSLWCKQISKCTKEAMFSIRMIMILSAQALKSQNSRLVTSFKNL
jgi:hypothetical protein